MGGQKFSVGSLQLAVMSWGGAERWSNGGMFRRGTVVTLVRGSRQLRTSHVLEGSVSVTSGPWLPHRAESGHGCGKCDTGETGLVPAAGRGAALPKLADVCLAVCDGRNDFED